MNEWGAGDPGAPMPDESRRSKILGPLQGEGVRGVGIAVVSTLVVLIVIIVIAVNSPNWLLFKKSFFNGTFFREDFPDIAHAFLRNIVYFLLAEPVILAFALLLAVMRSLRGPVFFPIRAMAIIYVDFFRGIPTILVVYLLGFGIPSMQIPGLPVNGSFWAVVGLVLSYSAYVAEVYRAGIESVHTSQTAAARSLGLSRLQTLRYVIVPQAVRRVVPPLMNDFIALQKDTALVAIIGGNPPEAFLQGQIYQSAQFNFTALVGVALCFLIITVPQTRFADWMVARRRAKQQSGGAL
jgi:polar amino acid transport system permease protein